MGCDAEYSGCSRFTFWKSLGVVRSETRFRPAPGFVESTGRPRGFDVILSGTFLPSIPIVELISGWNLACDVHDDGLPIPALDQLLLAEISPQELVDKLHAAVFEKLRVGFQSTVEGHRDFPWARKDLRILDRHLVMYGVTRNRREAFPPPKKLRQTWAALASSHNTHYVTPPQSGKPRKWPPDTCGMVFEKLILGTCGRGATRAWAGM